MPSLGFVLPDWMYWSGIVVFPLLAMWLVRREQHHGPPPNASYPIAYLLWLCGGFVGLHRFYLRSWLGVVYIPLFVAILVGNVQVRDARLEVSAANQEIMKAEFLLERAVDSQGADSNAALEAERKAEAARQAHADAQRRQQRTDRIISGIAALVAILLLIDACLIPGLVREYRRRHGDYAPPPPVETVRAEVKPVPPLPHNLPGRIVWVIDRISGWTGHFVAYWSVIAVFVYFYEVIARYVFNSPTNWAHESMFLMFGMFYLIAGAFALREDAHVRVDVLYQYLPRRGQAILDLVTSVFFFIFCGAMLWTGWTFASNSIDVWEVSFTEWAIQYWVVKLAIPVGAALILLQGLAEVLRNVAILLHWDVPGVSQPHVSIHAQY